MFTGIIQTTGIIQDCYQKKDRLYLTIKSNTLWTDVKPGDSIAVDGVCLTVVSTDNILLTFEIMPETARNTTLSERISGDEVNLESALRLSEPLGGHLVYGHVDTVGQIVAVEADGENNLISIRVPITLVKYVITRGAVTFDGLSLTVARLNEDVVTVSLTEETQRRTTWGTVTVGKRVNVEVDVIGKYIESFIHAS